MLQQLIDVLFRHPRSTLKRYKRFGGFFSYQAMLKGQRQMQAAALRLPPVYAAPGGLPVYMLTGKKYLYQTLFCIESLAKAGVNEFEYHLVDDGTFDETLILQIKLQLPGTVIHTAAEINSNIERTIPSAKFPVIHSKRRVYPHLKKLSDVHTIAPYGWKLVIDADMLFWSKPQEMIDWLKVPVRPLYMQDCQNSYGYTEALMHELCGSTIANQLNVGVIGLNSAMINWMNIEHWIARLEDQEGTNYYLEQALTAMLIGNQNSEVLPSKQYIVNPDDESIASGYGILHHYVDLSKQGYFKTAWKKII
ncbi:hypothetical protein GCM10027037_24100 [Mucilaginibacter koreensis]